VATIWPGAAEPTALAGAGTFAAADALAAAGLDADTVAALAGAGLADAAELLAAGAEPHAESITAKPTGATWRKEIMAGPS